jgi:hypothetical protein
MPLYRATAEGPVELTPEEESEMLALWEANSAPQVPTVVTQRQARLALYNAGVLGAVNQAVASADELTQITWEYAQEVRRTDPYVSMLGQAIGLTDEQIDELFITAATL